MDFKLNYKVVCRVDSKLYAKESFKDFDEACYCFSSRINEARNFVKVLDPSTFVEFFNNDNDLIWHCRGEHEVEIVFLITVTIENNFTINTSDPEISDIPQNAQK